MFSGDLTFDANGVTRAVPVDRCNELGVYINGDGEVISAGVVTVETYCPETALAGTDNFGAPTGTSGWATTGVTINANLATLGAQGWARVAGAFSLIRCRVTTPLAGGGAITARITGNAVS